MTRDKDLALKTLGQQRAGDGVEITHAIGHTDFDGAGDGVGAAGAEVHQVWHVDRIKLLCKQLRPGLGHDVLAVHRQGVVGLDGSQRG